MFPPPKQLVALSIETLRGGVYPWVRSRCYTGVFVLALTSWTHLWRGSTLWSPVEGKRGIWVPSVARRESWNFVWTSYAAYSTRLPRWRLSSQIRWLKAFLVWLTLAKANSLSLHWKIQICARSWKRHFALVTKNVICLTKYNMFNNGIEYIASWFW